MAHNLKENDHMLAVGQRPWHGLGTTLEIPPATAEEALRISKLDWTVHREPLFLGNGKRAVVTGSVSSSNDGQHAAIVRDDTEDILGVVGPGYVPFQNSQMGELFDPLIQDGLVDIETCGSLFNGRRVWFLAKFKSPDMEIDKGDTVRKYLTLAHGHDGCFAVRFGFTPIRIVCWNTLSMAMQKESGSRLMRCLHTANLEQNLVMLRDSMVKADEVFELTAEQYRILASRGVSRASLREYARLVIEAPEKEAEWTAGQKSKIGKMVGAAIEGRGNRGQNWWHAYNGVTEYLTWEAGRRQDNRLDSAWFGPNMQLSAKALDLALSLSA
jgi:phage/plasmid-like protein (TIGR03299 family)